MTDIYPGRRSFFKYTTPETALIILKSKTVRYSSPLTFNDPFDVQAGLHLDFNLEDFPDKLVDHIEKFATAQTAPLVDKEHPNGQLALIARKQAQQIGFDKSTWLKMLKPSFETDLAPIIIETQQNFISYWKDSLPSMRVFCVSEDRDNLLMWSHYAKDHQGVVFEFLSLPDRDNALSVAQKVEYVTGPPPFFNEQEWLDDFLTIKPFDTSLLHRRYVLHKSREWHYEKEWRVWYPTSKEEGLHDLIPINSHEIPAIFIGCRANAEFANELIRQARESFPNIRIFQAKRRTNSYTLEYEEIPQQINSSINIQPH